MHVFVCNVEVSKAPCLVHGRQCSRKATVRDGVKKTSAEGSPCILFSTILSEDSAGIFFFGPEMLNTCCSRVFLFTGASRMGKNEGMETNDQKKRQVHDVYLKDKVDQKFLG